MTSYSINSYFSQKVGIQVFEYNLYCVCCSFDLWYQRIALFNKVRISECTEYVRRNLS